MARKKQTKSGKNHRPTPSKGERRAPPHTARKAKQPPGGTGTAVHAQVQEAATAPGAANAGPPAGLDAARHAALQKTAQEADVLRHQLFSFFMSDALGYHQLFDRHAYEIYLARMLAEAGSPTDPIEQMMICQLCMAHLRIGQLHVSAGGAQSPEGARIYNSLAARLLGEFRRTALGLRAYRTHVPEGKPERLQISRQAQ